MWATDLADIARSAGLTVIEQTGWKTRSNSTGGLVAVMGIVVHHTAGGVAWDGLRESDYLTTGHPLSPVGNLYLDRKGQVWVQAAGSTNTAGKGGPRVTSKGSIPLDSANSRTINIEAGNNGVGEPWPDVQQDAYVRLCAGLCLAYGLRAETDVFAHFEWAPTRKIDPAGQSRYATGSAKWNMVRFRSDISTAMHPAPPIPPPVVVPDPPIPPEVPPVAAQLVQIIPTYLIGHRTRPARFLRVGVNVEWLRSGTEVRALDAGLDVVWLEDNDPDNRAYDWYCAKAGVPPELAG